MTRLSTSRRPIPRLHRLLLAGTFVPTLLLPAAQAFAQAPDQGGEHRPRREHAGDAGGGLKGEGGHRDRQGERGGDAERRQGGVPGGDKGREQGGPRNAEGPRGHAAEAEPGRRDRKNADAEAPGAPRPGETRREKRQMQGEGGAAGPGAMPPQRGPARDAAPSQRAPTRDAATPAENGRPGRAGPDQRMGGAPDQRQRTGDRDRGPDAAPPRDDARRPDARDPDRRIGRDDRRDDRPDRRPGVGVAVGVGAAAVGAGFAGGFLAPTDARRLDDVRRDRREVRDGDQTFIREPGRTIVEQGNRAFIVHDENDRFRALGLDVRRERRGADFVDTARRPNGELILTYTDGTGRLLRRIRRTPDGREFVLIDNGVGGRIGRYEEDVIDLPPPPIRIPRDRYIVDYRLADAGLIYDTLIAPPLVALPRRYTLDQIRYSPDIRSYVRSVDINTINFATASWDVPPDAGSKLQALATAINRAIDRNPNSVFLVEGFTDAVGNANDNLSLSDRRAQSVAEILTKDFNVPPENLTTQGYGEQDLIEKTDGPSVVNRRVVVQNITQLLATGGAPPASGQ